MGVTGTMKKLFSRFFTFILVASAVFCQADYASLMARFKNPHGPLCDERLVNEYPKAGIINFDESTAISSATNIARNILVAAKTKLGEVPGFSESIASIENYFDIVQKSIDARRAYKNPPEGLAATAVYAAQLQQLANENPGLKIRRIRIPKPSAASSSTLTDVQAKVIAAKQGLMDMLTAAASIRPDLAKAYKSDMRAFGLNGKKIIKKARETERFLATPIETQMKHALSSVYELEAGLIAEGHGDKVLRLGYLFDGRMPDIPANRMLLSSPTKIEFRVKGGDLIVSQEFDLITLLRIIECKRAKSGKRYVSNLYVQNLIVSLIDRFTNLSESVKKLFRGKEVMLSICYTIPRSPTMDADEKHIMHHNISFSNGKDHHCQTLSLDGCPIKQKHQIGVLKEIAPGIKNITVAIKIKGPEDIAKLKRFLQEHGIMPKKITSRSPSPSPVSWLKQLEEDAASPTASDDSEFTDSESETDSATSSRSMTPLSRFSKSPMSISRTSS